MLISVEEAHLRIENEDFAKPRVIVSKTFEAYGKIVASDIKALNDIPATYLSAMDGYAFNTEDLKRFGRLKVAGKIYIGDPIPDLGPGEAYYVVTGAPIPKGANSIVRVEASRIDNGYLTPVEKIWPGKDIIPPGDIVKKNSYIARKGDIITPYRASLLIYSGIYEVPIYDLSIGVVAIGSELAEFNDINSDHDVKVDSISPLIIGLLKFGFPKYLGVAADDLRDIEDILYRSLDDVYSIITIGGTSMGERDLVKKAVRNIGGKILFEGINVNVLKRGSIGVLNGKPLAMLPGQCVAAATFFHEFYLHVISKTTNARFNLSHEVELGEDIKVTRKMDSLYLFRLGDDGKVYPLTWGPGRCFELSQSSFYGILSRGKIYRRGHILKVTRLIGNEYF